MSKNQEHHEKRSSAEAADRGPSSGAGRESGNGNETQTASEAQADGGAQGQINQDGPDETVSETEQIDALKSRLEQATKDVLMAQAELENYRKRTRRDVETQIRYATVPLLQDILQVRDNLHRALEASGSGESGESSALRQGVAMVSKMLDDALSKHGCNPIPAVGEAFDPNFHEAISQVPSDEHPSGIVAHEAVKGFRLHDRVVRPSQVVVSTGPATT